MTFIALVSTVGDRWKTEVSFCVTHYTNKVELSAMLVPDEKSSAKSSWCITYTAAGNDEGKLADMKDAGFICDCLGMDHFVRHAHPACDGLGHNDQTMNMARQKINDCAHGA